MNLATAYRGEIPRLDRDDACERLRRLGIATPNRLIARVLGALGDDAGAVWVSAFLIDMEGKAAAGENVYALANWAAKHPPFFRFEEPTRSALRIWADTAIRTDTEFAGGWLLLRRWLSFRRIRRARR